MQTTLQITPIPAFKDNYIWVIQKNNSPASVIVDPGDATPVIKYLQDNRLTLAAILITHHHHDHTAGIQALIQRYPDTPVYGPRHESIAGVNQLLDEFVNIYIPELDLPFTIFETPGHTIGHIAYFNNNILFCGDTLFTGGCGRLFEGTPEQMLASLNKLATLPETTRIYCAHEYTESNLQFALKVEPENFAIQQRLLATQRLQRLNLPTVPSTLKLEKQTNPFLRCAYQSVKRAAEQYAGKKLLSAVEIFTVIREWKNNL